MRKRVLKSGEIRFYNKGRIASDVEIKNYIKSDFAKINKSDLPAEYQGYYGKVQGGKNRASKAPRIEGKYIYSEFSKKLKLDTLAEIRGFKNAKDLLDNDKNFAASLKNLYYGKGLEYSYNSDNIITAINKFHGKIIINGKEYNKHKAIEKIDKVDKSIKRKFENFLNIFHVKYTKGGAIINMSLPTNIELHAMDSDNIEDVDIEGVDLIFSGKKK